MTQARDKVDERVSVLVTSLRTRLQEKLGGVENLAEFARVNDLDRRALNRYLHEGTEPTVSSLLKLSEALDVSLDELAFGKQAPLTILPPSDDIEGYVRVPFLDVRASAGPGRLSLPADTVAQSVLLFSQVWLRNLGVSPHAAELLHAEGDSMSPTIQDGDLMLVDRGFGEVVHGKIYALVYNGLVVVKRVQRLAAGGILLISDNERYPSETIGRDEIGELNVQGRVAWYGRAI
jgi:transcriptional regulator with XRE-family HTH domain